LPLAFAGGGLFSCEVLMSDTDSRPNEKRVNCIKVCFDDPSFIALGRMAAREDRKVADLVHLIVRRHLYGNYQRDAQTEEGTLGD
jgi:hypothetical protein